MSSVWNDEALKEALQQLVNGSPPTPNDRTLRLFTNNLTPANTDGIGDYTECSDPSYNGIVLIGSLWTITSISGGQQASYSSQTFSFAAGNSLYGWYLTDSGATKVYAAGNFASPPVVVPSGGGTYGVQVTLPAITP